MWNDALAEHSAATVLRSKIADLPEGTFTVAIESGANPGRSIELDGAAPSRVLVGQSAACDLVVEDAQVSRRHLALEIVGRRLRVLDLGSTNGTTVDHVAVESAFLNGGEHLRIGATTLLVTRHAGGQNAPVPAGNGFGRVRGESRAMRRLYPLCKKLAAAAVPVIIEGETGTGKEVLAESLHEESPRATGPFVVFDCTAVPPNLIESELFGHEKGAFTGATTARKGVFEQAHGGTLLIDEIGDLDLALQPKLLRVIERGEVRRVGGNKAIRVDVRILAATRRDLDRAVQTGSFRDDLLYRLAVGRIELPPLRARSGDVAALALHFWKRHGGKGAPGAALLARWDDYAWPGNVRELQNAVARAIAIGDEDMRSATTVEPATATTGGDFIGAVLEQNLGVAAARQRVIDEFERRYVERLLAEHGGVVTHAAAASGIARRHFQRLRAKSRDR